MKMRERLERKLSESFAEPWGTRGMLRPEIVGLVEDPRAGAISGTINIYVPTRSGQDALVLAYPFGTLQSDADVDDCVAEALSRLLAVHSSWPR